MNTINCRIKLNEYHDGPGRDITPAEAILLRSLHDPAAARQATIANGARDQAACWKMIINPVAVGVAQTQVPDPEGEDAFTLRDRTDIEEISRLKQKYPVRGKAGTPGSHLVEDFWPGLAPKLPQTFEEIGMEVAAPVPVKRGAGRPKKEAELATA